MSVTRCERYVPALFDGTHYHILPSCDCACLCSRTAQKMLVAGVRDAAADDVIKDAATPTATPTPPRSLILHKTKDINDAGMMVNLHWKNLRRNVFMESRQVEKYGMFAMAVPDLMKLTAWRSHQELLANGLLKECGPDDEVIFVSQSAAVARTLGFARIGGS